jgi:hypothetical protein
LAEWRFIFSIVCGFPRYARKTAHKQIGKYIAAAGENTACCSFFAHRAKKEQSMKLNAH